MKMRLTIDKKLTNSKLYSYKLYMINVQLCEVSYGAIKWSGV